MQHQNRNVERDRYEGRWSRCLVGLVFSLEVVVVLILVKKGVVPLGGEVLKQVGGAVSIGTPADSSIQTSNYQSVDIGNPNF